MRNAPDGRSMSTVFTDEAGMTDIPNHVPRPRISRIEPKTKRDNVNPIPIPRASVNARRTVFLDANTSALAIIMQFTTIKGTNGPSALLSAGKYALRNRSTMVTNEAITIIKLGMRTSRGMIFLSDEMSVLEQTSTNNTARPIVMQFATLVETASVGHIPSKRRKTGFSFQRPPMKSPHNTCGGFLFSSVILSFSSVVAAYLEPLLRTKRTLKGAATEAKNLSGP